MYDLAQTRDLEAKVLVGQLSIAAHSANWRQSPTSTLPALQPYAGSRSKS